MTEGVDFENTFIGTETSPYATMPSLDSLATAKQCKHVEYRIGCCCCDASDMHHAIKEAEEHAKKHGDEHSDYLTSLARQDISPDDRAQFEGRAEKARQQHADWNGRSEGLRKFRTWLEAQVNAICSVTEPQMMTEAFEAVAVDCQNQLKQMWRDAFGTDMIDLQPASPNNVAQNQTLDMSKIPATADMLVTEGVGLQVFLRNTKNSEHASPMQAVGRTAGPAMMSYGRALRMFDTPDASNIPNETKKGSDANVSVKDAKESCTLHEDKPDPRTEEEFRAQGDSQGRSTAILSSDEQWALFKSGRFLSHTSILARQYVKLVKDKKAKLSNEDDIAHGNDDTSAATTSPAAETNEGWPDVEELDWAGFTNWVQRCKDTDKKFGSQTLPTWQKQRTQRVETVVSRLKAWQPPADLDLGESRQGDPRVHYPHDFYPVDMSYKELGITPSMNKRAPPPG